MHPGPKTGILGDPQPIWDSFTLLSPSWEVERLWEHILQQSLPKVWSLPPRKHGKTRSSPHSPISSSSQLRGRDSQLLMSSRSSSLHCRLANPLQYLPCVCVCVCVPHLGGNSSVRPRFPGDVSLALSTLTKERDWLTDRLSLMIECSFFWWPSDVVQTRSPCLLASSAVCRRGAALLKGGRWMHNLS